MKGKLLARNRPCAHAAPRAARLPTADHAHRSPPSCRAVQRVRRPVRPRRARLGAALARRRGSAVFRCNLPSPCTLGDAPHKLQQPRAITGRISSQSATGSDRKRPPGQAGLSHTEFLDLAACSTVNRPRQYNLLCPRTHFSEPRTKPHRPETPFRLWKNSRFRCGPAAQKSAAAFFSIFDAKHFG